MIDLTFLSENKVDHSECRAEFGLSMLIEAEGLKILFDTGASDMFYENAEKLGVDLRNVDLCVISHGHYDHTEGLPAFCRINETARIYLHKDALGVTYGTTDGTVDDYNCGILWDDAAKDKVMARVTPTDGPVWIRDNIVISGTIPDLPEFKPVELFYRETPSGLVPDTMSHEQFLAIGREDGIWLFSGCSHKGILAAVEYAKVLFPGKPIAGIIAGMHLLSASNEVRGKIFDRIAAEHPKILIPMHCTGLEAIVMARLKLGDKCLLAGAGSHYSF